VLRGPESAVASTADTRPAQELRIPSGNTERRPRRLTDIGDGAGAAAGSGGEMVDELQSGEGQRGVRRAVAPADDLLFAVGRRDLRDALQGERRAGTVTE